MHDAQGNILAIYRKNVLPGKLDFSLSEHSIYGSSRLGIKEYWPLQIGASWDSTSGLYDTTRLWHRAPWYSLEYQDLIKDTFQLPYGNDLQNKLITTHLTGQKQYEVTDHLGDVLANVSDNRRAYKRCPSHQ